ncbi:zinc-binding alcohol dehydrogenase family protein [Aspergillus aculeatinus CBS 121060]|uniref:GroES-like protein n=1 Tax=Aspergillus aculeatinus CBS 121060 TaxID=1448322 RepID=A0ACD1GXT4_9EURO|nr:GroES-like protein [Aspergillus aculeatinus CBS 121060]RAH66023.1 GroES-like protein [Aspergillus aculeatinus CBS 121060]
MSPSNRAAWLKSEKAYPLEVDEAAYTPPQEDEIVIKNQAVGLNLVDYAMQDMGTALFPWSTYPIVLGCDVAGEVVEVGPGALASRFKPGDRVLGLTSGVRTSRPADGGFQSYVVLTPQTTALIPPQLSFPDAAAIPLGISTAASGLFQRDHLALQFPRAPRAAPTGQTVLVWSGSSSVGSSAVQMAVAAGYEVFSTASPKNFRFVKSLGASQVFDYRSETVVEDVVAASQGRQSAGAFAVGDGSVELCAKIVAQLEGRKFVSLAVPPTGPLGEGIESKFVFGSDLRHNEVGPAIFEHFLPRALEDGSFRPALKVEVVGRGLESVQSGLDTLKKGVSATKLVVEL